MLFITNRFSFPSFSFPILSGLSDNFVLRVIWLALPQPQVLLLERNREIVNFISGINDLTLFLNSLGSNFLGSFPVLPSVPDFMAMALKKLSMISYFHPPSYAS